MQPGVKRREESISVFSRLGVLFGIFFIMLIAVSACALIIGKLHLNARTEALSIAALQCILVFIIPTLIYARVFSHNPFKTLEITNPLQFKQILGVIIAFIIGLPFLNQIIFWNESITLPSSMSSLETPLRDMENNALKATEILLNTSSIGGLISGIFIIGILTGFAEELFFRGGIQRGMEQCGINHHVAIWTAAFIFSAMHFQFFGFVPRILLGAFFGYLLYWSKSIWLSSLAHAINNSMVVITAWLTEKGIFSFDIERLGTNSNGFPWVALGSLVIFTVFIFFCGNSIFSSSTERIRPLKRNI